MEYLGHTYIKTFIIYLKFKFNWAFYVSSCLPPPTSPAFCQACPLAFTKCTENSLLILCPLWLAKKRYKESTRAFVFLGATLCLIMAELVSTSSSYSSLSPQALLCKGGPYPSSIPQHFKRFLDIRHEPPKWVRFHVLTNAFKYSSQWSSPTGSCHWKAPCSSSVLSKRNAVWAMNLRLLSSSIKKTKAVKWILIYLI